MKSQAREEMYKERNPRDMKDTRPFEIRRGLSPSPAWVVRCYLASDDDAQKSIVFRADSFDACVEAISVNFLPERKLLGEIRALADERDRLRESNNRALKAVADVARKVREGYGAGWAASERDPGQVFDTELALETCQRILESCNEES